MASSAYSLQLKALLDSGDMVSKLNALKEDLDARGITKIRMTMLLDEGGNLRGYSAKYVDELGKATTATGRFVKNIETGNAEAQQFTRSVDGATKSTNYFTQGMMQSIVTAAKYALSIGLIYKALAQLGEGVQYIKDLDKEMRNVQIVAGYTDSQIKDLSKDYNTLAKEMKVTTLEVAEGSLEWTRQGKTIEETQELLRSTMMLSKLGNVDSAEATEYLTSILNGYKLEIEDVNRVLDTMISLDNASATSVSEIAEALKRTTVTAQEAGVEFEELATMISVVSSVSRAAPERVGTSFRSILSRYMKVGKGEIDEDGQDINDVAAAIRRATEASGKSIEIIDKQTDSFRSFTDVLRDLYPIWDDLGTIERGQIAESLGGLRQKESLLVLLENEEMFVNLLGEAYGNTGLAADRYAIYLEGLEAAQNKAKASWESLWMATVEGDLVKKFYDTSSSVFEYVEALGGLDSALLILIPTMLAVKIGSMKMFAAFGAGLISNPIGLIAVAIAGVAVAMGNLIGKTKEFMMDAGNAWENHLSDVSMTVLSVDGLVDDYLLSLERVRKAYEESPWWFKVSMAAMREDVTEVGLQPVIDSIGETSRSWNEYLTAITQVAEAHGYLVDENGRLYKEFLHAGTGARVYSDEIKTLEQQHYAFANQHPVVQAALDGTIESMEESARRTGDLSESLDGLSEKFSSVSEVMENFSKISKDASDQEKEDAAAINKLLTLVINKIKEEQKAKKDALKDELAGIKESYDSRKEALKEELLGYKRIIDAKTDILDAMEKERDYQRSLSKKQDELSAILAEIEELRLDDSAEAIAKRRALEEEAAESREEIEYFQADRGVEIQKEALNQQYENFEKSTNAKIDILDREYEAFEKDFSARIDVIDEYLSQTGTITRDAMAQLEKGGISLYQSLIDWNYLYGSGIRNDVVGAWNDAYDAASRYMRISSNGGILSPRTSPSGGSSYYELMKAGIVGGYHDGGIVGGKTNASGEVFAKLLEGEVVTNQASMDNFIRRVLPSMMGAGIEMIGSSAGMSFDKVMEINVQGNLDSSVVPSIEKIANKVIDKMNQSMQRRGIVRPANAFTI